MRVATIEDPPEMIGMASLPMAPAMLQFVKFVLVTAARAARDTYTAPPRTAMRLLKAPLTELFKNTQDDMVKTNEPEYRLSTTASAPPYQKETMPLAALPTTTELLLNVH